MDQHEHSRAHVMRQVGIHDDDVVAARMLQAVQIGGACDPQTQPARAHSAALHHHCRVSCTSDQAPAT